MGEIKLKGNLENGKWNGQFTFFYMDGSVWSEGNYKEGTKHGEFIYYGIGNKNIYSKKKVENYIKAHNKPSYWFRTRSAGARRGFPQAKNKCVIIIPVHTSCLFSYLSGLSGGAGTVAPPPRSELLFSV